MKILKNTKLDFIPPVAMPIDSLDDLPYIPADPLPSKSLEFVIIIAPYT